ncbi:phosphate signaling complex protein PhoU [Candidatus Manganitrophus noduliformans]|uniref:Phosphate-specific transport system accessory protein PhoU n=1 Tax=Candidatus Manganitrophus noduliformans TaxID=2606439 RepID=A0A7X6DMH9_9BACT|nr:phosphate signaling complex protein PhoU [Candidatus Manganitrophus noduliformans]NKE69973.1 phosphate signaling complex protein PhoU [Candidatus Manganitrophus noduliformans]
MHRHFEEELTRLKEKILKMGALVETQIAASIKALVERDGPLAKQTIQNDHLVNAMDVEIDEECIRLLALYQPAARDLRFITTAMKITTDLERMSDLAEDICERSIELAEEPLLKPYIDIPRMADAAQKMVREALDAFVNKDAKLARKVCSEDQFIDELTHQIFRELLSFMVEDPTTITRAVRVSFIAKYIERIGDHATNIAEMVVYLVEGKIIRHTKV